MGSAACSCVLPPSPATQVLTSDDAKISSTRRLSLRQPQSSKPADKQQASAYEVASDKWQRTPVSMRLKQLTYGDEKPPEKHKPQLLRVPSLPSLEEIQIHSEMTQLVRMRTQSGLAQAPYCLGWRHRRLSRVQAARDRRMTVHKEISNGRATTDV